MEEILRIAHQVRKEAEGLQRDFPQEFSLDLCHMCGIASLRLYRQLKKAGIFSAFVMGNYHENFNVSLHCWVQLASGEILDITATQFGDDEVVLISPQNNHYQGVFLAKRALKEILRFRFGNPKNHWKWITQN